MNALNSKFKIRILNTVARYPSASSRVPRQCQRFNLFQFVATSVP